MPVLPQAFWYKVDGKLKQVFFEETKIPQEKREALLKQLQRTRLNFAGGANSGTHVADEQAGQYSSQKEIVYGWYPPAPGAQFMSVAQARLDQRVFKPHEQRAVPVIPGDRLRQPVSTQICPDGTVPCIPPYPTDPMAYRFSPENHPQMPTAKAPTDFARWENEETGRIPQWNDTVTFTLVPPPPNINLKTTDELQAANDNAVQRSGVTEMLPPGGPSHVIATQKIRQSSAQPSPHIDKASSKSRQSKHGSAVPPPASAEPSALSLRDVQEMQRKLSNEYRWRFAIHGDPFAVKSKVRPGRPSHWMPAKAEEPRQMERNLRYADSSTFFYNTIPVIPLSFSVGQGLASEKIIRERQAKQKYAPKSTPNDRYFIPSFIY